MRRYLIIGCGVAGISAAEAIRANDPSGLITMISDDPHGYYSRPGLAYYLSGEVPQKQLYIYTRNDWRSLNAKFVYGQASQLVPAEHRLIVNHSDIVNYDRLLLATGATSARLELSGGNLPGVVYLDSLEDTRHIIQISRKAKSIVVVGGGILALELVEGLRAHRRTVHFLMRGSRYWPNVLDETESRIVEGRLLHDGVIIHPHTEISSVLDKNGRMVAIKSLRGESIPADMLAVAIGVQPNISLARSANLETERGIIVNDYLQSSSDDIFAAGDVAQVYDPETGRKSLDLLWHPARRQGRTAGKNMAGVSVRYQRQVAINVLRLAGVMTTIIGSVGGRGEEEVSMMRGSSETWRQLPNTISVASGGGINQVRLLLGEKTMHGAVVMGDQTLSQPIQELISNKVDISSIRALLQEGNEKLGHNLMEFWYTIKKHP